MEVSPFLPLCDGLHIAGVTPSAKGLLVQVFSSSPNAYCPLCGAQAWRIHSRYSRRVADLPCVGQQLTLLLTVRKFFCPNSACPRNIFAEQFPDLVPAYARLTTRLREALVSLGASVVALDDLSGGDRKNLESFGPVEFVEGTILDREVVARCTRGCNYVFHQAALGSVIVSEVGGRVGALVGKTNQRFNG